jgi:hypothetical protein
VSREIENLRGAISLGENTIKLLVLVNGGAVIAVLTFYGNVLTRNPEPIAFNKGALTTALLSYGVGVFLAVLCSCSTAVVSFG